MLAKSAKFLFKFLLVTACLALLGMNVFGLTMYWCFGELNLMFSFGLGSIFCFAAGVFVFACGKRSQCRQNEQAGRLWQYLVEDLPVLKHARTGFLILKNLLCVAGIALALQCIFWFGGISIGLIANEIGAHELGERVFVVIPDPMNCKGDITLAGVWDIERYAKPDCPKHFQINGIIAKVYGASTPQMAHRLASLGVEYRVAAVKGWLARDEQKSRKNFSAASPWFRDALALYRSQENRFECAYALSNIAYCQIKQGFTEEALESYKEANQLLSSYSSGEGLKDTLTRLATVAYYLDLTEECDSLMDRAKTITSIDGELQSLWLPWIGLALVVIWRVARTYSLAMLAFVWRRKHMAEMDQISPFRWLSRLTTLELSRGNIDSANALSLQMLKVVGVVDCRSNRKTGES